MRILGIDLSSQDVGTSACSITWTSERAIVSAPYEKCSDRDLDNLIESAHAVGIDAPFGWPVDFQHAVEKWSFESWSPSLRDKLRFRETDRFARELLGRWPLSVSSDLVALPAMRAMSLLRRHGITDKSGQQSPFYEVYPSGSLKIWNLNTKGYKKEKTVRTHLLNEVRQRLPALQIPDQYATTDHNFDALVCALTTRLAVLGATRQPDSKKRSKARIEGWIHLPKGPLDPTLLMI